VFLLGRRSAYTSIVHRLRGGGVGHAQLDDVATDQLVGGLLVSAADKLRLGTNETLGFYLEVGVDGLRDVGEELGSFVGLLAALFVDVTDDVTRTFPAEHRAEVLLWLEAFSSECVGGSVRVWRGDA
jgi:hypothetical protein